MSTLSRGVVALVACFSFTVLGCGDADDLKIGGECAASGECENDELICLTAFKGGYCGQEGCAANADCVDKSICVKHNGTNYCFRVCKDKAECNENRTADFESNCSSNIERTDGGTEKACVPPSGP